MPDMLSPPPDPGQAGGKEHNSADSFIANVDENCEGKGIRVEAMKDGSFKLVDARNKYEKSYYKAVR